MIIHESAHYAGCYTTVMDGLAVCAQCLVLLTGFGDVWCEECSRRVHNDGCVSEDYYPTCLDCATGALL